MANGQSTSKGTPPIAKCFALVILLALGGLILLRQMFGSIRLDVGTR